METRADASAPGAPESRCALSPESRLDVFRLLAQGGPDGRAAASARHCRAQEPACSFHLRELDRGGLLRCCRHDRSQVYTANFRAIRALLGYLTGHCCSEAECSRESPPAAERGPMGRGREPRPGWLRPATDPLADRG